MTVNGPNDDFTLQIAQIQERLNNPQASPEERAQLTVQLNALQISRPQAATEKDGTTNNNSQTNVLEDLWNRIRDAASVLLKPSDIKCVENDSALYVGAAGKEGDLAAEAESKGAFEPAADAKQLAGQLFEAAATATEQGIADKKAEKSGARSALPAQ